MKLRLHRALLPAVFLGMQACWLYAWLSVIELSTIGHIGVSPIPLLFLPLGAVAWAYITRLPLRLFQPVLFWFLWVIAAALCGKLVLYPDMPWSQPDWLYALPAALVRLIFEVRAAELLLLCGCGCAWYLGGRASGQRITYGRLLTHFQFGLALMLGAFLLAYGRELPAGHPVLLALVFFGLSLSGIALMRSQREGGGIALPSNRQFTGSLLSVIITVSLLGLLAGIAITPGLVGAIIDAARFVVYVLLGIIAFLFSLLPQGGVPEGADLEPPATGDDQGLLEFYRSLPLPAILRRILFIGWGIVVIGMLLFALWRICEAVLQWLRRRGNMTGIEIESLDSGLLADLLALLLWLKRESLGVWLRIKAFLQRSLRAEKDISWGTLYAELLRWAGKKLQPRAPSQSAHEYQYVLSGLLPAASPDLAYVTETYSRARYGGYEPDDEALRQMQQAVHRIRHLPRRRQHKAETTKIEGAE